jgi:adenylosuccinate synthase
MEPDLALPGIVGNTSVVGLQWGDEGKGKIVDLLTSHFDYAVRWNGGSNAGHSVKVGDKKYAFHLIPSGILHPTCTSVLANGVVIDPAQLLQEMDQLVSDGIALENNLRISSQAHVVMPYHKLQDQLSEQRLGENKLGTTARGIGPCYADKAGRSMAIRMADLLDETRLKDKLQRVVADKNHLLKSLYAAPPLEWVPMFEQYRGYGQLLRPYVCNTSALLHHAMDDGKRLLFEGANAVLLDLDHGTFPFVTSSNCGTGLSAGTGVPAQAVKTVLGVVKAYCSRVGSGPFPTEQENATGERIRTRGHEFGTTTGRPRRCGWLDLVALRYSTRICGVTGLCIMLLDVLSTFDTLRVCTGYNIGGEITTDFPADAYELQKAQAVYEDLPGWHDTLDDVRILADLPANARKYLDTISSFVNVPVRVVSVGPARHQTLICPVH